MEFEYDPIKSETNKRKHGIDFIEAQLLWEDSDYIQIPAKTSEEQRFLIIGRMLDRHWSAVITHREEKIRIISVRRARQEEVDIYES